MCGAAPTASQIRSTLRGCLRRSQQPLSLLCPSHSEAAPAEAGALRASIAVALERRHRPGVPAR
jgi:hypothetical protein